MSLKEKEYSVGLRLSRERAFLKKDVKEAILRVEKYLCECDKETNKLCRSCKVILLEFGDWKDE